MEKRKQKRKPGWQQAEKEYQEWLHRVSTMTSGIQCKTKPRTTQVSPVALKTLAHKIPSLQTPGGAATKPVHRPEIMYKDQPDLLERELKARERKFTTAPVYNKGGDVLITDDMMKDIMSGKTRRR